MSMRNVNGPEVVTFKDGGFGSNNPSEETYYEIANKHGGSKNMGPFIGIGTGSASLNMFPGKEGEFKHLRNTVANLKTAMKKEITTVEAQEKMIDTSNDDKVEQSPHYTFNGGDRPGKWALLSGKITEAATAIYLQGPDVQQDLKEVAKILVERRRRANKSGWDRYASFLITSITLESIDTKRSPRFRS